MAARQIKRLQQQLQTSGDPGVDGESSEDGDGESLLEAATASKPFNPFDLLSDDEGPAPEDEDEDGEQQEVLQQPTPPPASLTSASNKSKKSKKKKKGKGKKERQVDEEDGDDAAGQEEEDLDELLHKLNISLDKEAAAAQGGSSVVTAGPPVLALDTSSLRGDEELRGLFGADVVEVVEREEQRETARHTRRPRGLPGGQRPSLKKYLLCTPKDYWPPHHSTLTMELKGTKDGCQVFRYVHNPAYAAAQRLFEESQATMDPNAIMAVLHNYPYHVDALLTMYELYHHMGENQDADEVLHRALFALETAWHPRFTPASSTCRLEFSVKENRPLFVAVFRHMQRLSRSGCHHTATECCKMLLALDPEDPLGCLQYIDYLALRAGKYTFLQRLVSEFPTDTSLALLPNFAYSVALSRYNQQAQASSESTSGRGRGRGRGQSKAADQSQPSSSYEEREATELLVEALLLHPLVLMELMQRLQQAGVNKDAIWTSILGHKLFASATDGGSSSLSHLVSIYVERSHLLWKVPDVLQWLKRAAGKATEVADGTADWSGPSATDWECVRKDAFPPSTSNEYNHLRTHEFSDVVNALPREEVQAAMAAGGLMEVEAALAELHAQAGVDMQARQQAGGGAVTVTQDQLQNGNPLAMLLYSLLPWVDAGQQPDYSDQNDRGQQPPGGGN